MSYFFAGVVYETAIPAAIAMRQLTMNPNSYFKTFVAVRAIINTVAICSEFGSGFICRRCIGVCDSY